MEETAYVLEVSKRHAKQGKLREGTWWPAMSQDDRCAPWISSGRNAVLENVRRSEFRDTLIEMRRMLSIGDSLCTCRS